MHNVCMFNVRHGVKAYVKTLKGIVIWYIQIVEHVRIIHFVKCIFKFFYGFRRYPSLYIGRLRIKKLYQVNSTYN